MSSRHLVVTTIASPNSVLKKLASGAASSGDEFIVIGDSKSPANFDIPGARFYSLEAQNDIGLNYADLAPRNHYARKNIGYLIAMKERAQCIIETDDDNSPLDEFFGIRHKHVTARPVSEGGWVNVYACFSDATMWPRGLPLDSVMQPPPQLDEPAPVLCPIQQGLAQGNPDVDAVYRLVHPLPQQFRDEQPVSLGRGSWCPLNSQNTTWFPEAYPLLYLPAYCSFRMTDIWRSFVAQRIAWENDWSVLFHKATVVQDRNEHDLMKDFADEIPGYLNNRKIASKLESLGLKKGVKEIPDNLRRCYEEIIALGCITEDELPLLEAWLHDIVNVGKEN